jgi:hypothetical protein
MLVVAGHGRTWAGLGDENIPSRMENNLMKSAAVMPNEKRNPITTIVIAKEASSMVYGLHIDKNYEVGSRRKCENCGKGSSHVRLTGRTIWYGF